MALYKQWQNSETSKAAIWKIEEPESFFTEQTGLVSDKKFETRRLEHLAGRFLLKYILPNFQLHKIQVSPLGKPFVEEEKIFFSISHSFPFVGVTIDTTKETGIDVQTLQPKILRLQHKFLSPAEQEFCGNDSELITLAWAAKEAAFKKYGLGAVDFIKHMPITQMDINDREAELTMEFAREIPSTIIHLQGGLEKDFAWSVTR